MTYEIVLAILLGLERQGPSIQYTREYAGIHATILRLVKVSMLGEVVIKVEQPLTHSTLDRE